MNGIHRTDLCFTKLYGFQLVLSIRSIQIRKLPNVTYVRVSIPSFNSTDDIVRECLSQQTRL